MIPAVLVAKLALAEGLQGQGLGTELLRVALEQILEAAGKVGGRLVVKLSTVARALGAEWP